MTELGRLRWRCRRGMKELDVLLERWLERDAAVAKPDEIGCFEALLDLQDPQLARYLLAGDPHPESATAALIERIRRA
ncbi:MAG: succinate dehydrogenase assembly factor 2 [Sinobacteraceae bacterium]|nr:succinate dehydrogenase assembly factor 2 [Nevskiaceae bacterium]